MKAIAWWLVFTAIVLFAAYKVIPTEERTVSDTELVIQTVTVESDPVHRGVWRVPVIVTRVIDADTIEVDADLGWGVWKRKMAVRIDGLWSPENSTEEGKAATEWARGFLPVGTQMTLHSKWVLTFNRVVGTLYFNSTGDDYAVSVVEAGHGEIR